ncbi:Arc family DNA-binding protein [Agrobacterium pusense]|uniref:Arc family DNA-binding protein n=1 Tax=Agrobacterium pusense TaxID=648995 RepID=UPI0035A707BF
MAPKQTDPQFKLRLPPELKLALDEAAFLNNRSVSAEILARLTESFRDDVAREAFDKKIAELTRKQEKTSRDIEELRKRLRD